jgi:hypothetical protein
MVGGMKAIQELRKPPRLMIAREGADGGMAQAYLSCSKKERPCAIVFSWGGGWEHVSVSFSNRCPTWEEMCEVKRMFWRDDECVVQFHPIESEYVNNYPYCLHMWRIAQGEFPTPPSWMVGVKKGQSLTQAIREGVG